MIELERRFFNSYLKAINELMGMKLGSIPCAFMRKGGSSRRVAPLCKAEARRQLSVIRVLT